MDFLNFKLNINIKLNLNFLRGIVFWRCNNRLHLPRFLQSGRYHFFISTWHKKELVRLFVCLADRT